MSEKKKLRKQIQTELAELSRPMYEHLSFQIARNLYEDERWKTASIVGMTISRLPEVDTYQLIRKAWEEGKKVVVPKCDPATKTLDFRVLTCFSELESVYFGLLEPIPSKTEAVSAANIDLLIVPGLAFSKNGYRLGFGGGYYDRFLLNYEGDTVSLAFKKQLIPKVPVEDHDIPVEKIITEDEVIIVGN